MPAIRTDGNSSRMRSAHASAAPGLPPSRKIEAPRSAAAPVSGNTEEVGWLLYTSYLIPFEIASMLLLVAMIGAIVLAKREL